MEDFSRKRELAVRSQLMHLLNELPATEEKYRDGIIPRVESILSAIVHELNFDYAASALLDYYYWDALADAGRPGKFERQPAYVPFLYQATLEDMHTDEVCSEYGTGECIWFFDDAQAVCPWAPAEQIAIASDEQGFVFEIPVSRYHDALDALDELGDEEE